MKDERNLWHKLLRIEAPWTVLECRADDLRRRYDVSIAVDTPRGWFGLPRGKQQAAARQVSWRHVNFGEWEIHVHVAVPANADLSALSWVGEGDLPFTRALSQQVFAFLREGSSLQSICILLNLPIAELWRFRYAIDSGRWAAGEGTVPGREPQDEPAPLGDGPAIPAVPVSNGTVAPLAAAPAARDDAHDSGIPDLTDPVWSALLQGSHQIDIRVLGLKLMLSRLRAQFELISDDEVRLLKLHELHRYFVKNRRLLAHELAQLGEIRS